ncbi:hypothetical protein ACWEFJ_31640 [Actinosynnema sp. NPDC004786]
MAMHAGEVHRDRHGSFGEAVNDAFRLLDSAVLVGPSLFHATPALNRFQGVPATSTLDELPPPEAERVLADLAARLARL